MKIHKDSKLASAFRKFKEESRLSWAKIGYRIGVSGAHSQYLASGRVFPSKETAMKICKFIGRDISEFDDIEYREKVGNKNSPKATEWQGLDYSRFS